MPWNPHILWAFQNGSDGSAPAAGLIFDSQGKSLYGTAKVGGALQGPGTACGGSGCGTVFQLTPPANGGVPWNLAVLYNFTNSDGKEPLGRLIFDNQGKSLFGTTFLGGAYDNGTVFQLTPPANGGVPWHLAFSYSFQGASDGSVPAAGLIFDPRGNLYGTTTSGGAPVTPTGTLGCGGNGCGTVFELSPIGGGSWGLKGLYSFEGASGDGANPWAGLIVDKRDFSPYGIYLYGTTATGGPGCAGTPQQSGCGTVFQLNTGSLVYNNRCAHCSTAKLCCLCAGGTWSGSVCF